MLIRLSVTEQLNALNPLYADTLGGITTAYNKDEAAVAALQNTVAQLLVAQDGSTKQANQLLSTHRGECLEALPIIKTAKCPARISSTRHPGPRQSLRQYHHERGSVHGERNSRWTSGHKCKSSPG